MAFRRFANAIVVHPHASQRGWDRMRTASRVAGTPSANLSMQASEILGKSFDPSAYLLSHCTIVASVDVEKVTGVKLGAVKEDGKRINRKYADYRVTAETDRYINNNYDCFPRNVLLKSYRTFIGAHNFCEHVQVEDLSKGRIIDAVARDIGESIYVDILVATDRKHSDLVRDIEAGRMGTLSMGCQTETTTCTKCGNVAVDETELCDCVRYAKGNVFLDEAGRRHRVAETCGHESVDPTGGVTFIEGSWVGSPAFTGAVMRNIITPESMSQRTAQQAQRILASPPPQWVDGGQRKAAAERLLGEFDFGDPPAEGGGEDAPKDEAEKAPASPTKFDDLEDRVLQDVLDRVERKINDEVDGPRPSPEDSSAGTNDNLNREASYVAAVGAILKKASSDVDLVDRVAGLDGAFGRKAPVAIYRAALSVGSSSKHGSIESFLLACRGALGRSVSPSEARTLLRIGRILSHVRGDSPRPTTPHQTRSKR